MANPALDAAMQRENTIYQRETQGVAGALYVASAPVLGNATDLSLRTPDGVHLTPTGAGLLARAVIDAVDVRWHLSLTAPMSLTAPT
jgi:lysophospholipase L1-like esterase